MPLVPNRFLFRLAYPCKHFTEMPSEGDDLLDLPESYRLDNFAAMDQQRNFADFRLAWNEHGLGVQVEVRGKDKPIAGDASRPRHSDGFSLWIDTRDARSSHRASRHCHLFHFLATGGGPDKDDPAFVQWKINRALQDAPQVSPRDVPLRFHNLRGGYRLEAFLPAGVLNGFDPEQNPRLGFFYVVHDLELGDQTLSAATDLPYAEDPTLWSVLELVPKEGKK
jgi:hypothetical protein